MRRRSSNFRWYDHHTTNTYRTSCRFLERRRTVARTCGPILRSRPLSAASRPSSGVFSLEVFVHGMAVAHVPAARSSMRSGEVSGSI